MMLIYSSFLLFSFYEVDFRVFFGYTGLNNSFKWGYEQIDKNGRSGFSEKAANS